MPVHTGKDSKGCFAQWGSRAKYYYPCGDDALRDRAKQKAHIQGAAIIKKTGIEALKTNLFGLLVRLKILDEAVSDKPWSNVDKSKLPKSAFLWIEGDGKTKAQWHLPYKDAQGNVNLGALRAISAAIAGARTGKPMSVPANVRKRINNLLKKYKIGKFAKQKAKEQFEPPEAGDAPKAVKDILKNVYNSCRGTWVKAHPKDRENANNKESCSKQAWGAVKNAGWSKGADGKWTKS